MDSGSQQFKSQGRRRGYNVNSAGRSYDNSNGSRVRSVLQPFSGNSNRRGQGNRDGGYNNGGGNNNGGGGFNRAGHHENRNIVDNNLIDVQWNYDTSKAKSVKSEFVKRNGQLSEKFGDIIKLMTNHFSFQFDVNIYHYKLSWSYCAANQETGEKTKDMKLNRAQSYQLFDAVMDQNTQYFTSKSVGYDGNEDVYLPYELAKELPELDVKDAKLEGKASPCNFKVSLKFERSIRFESISEYYNGTEKNDLQRKEAIKALHIILKFPARYNMIALGRLAMFPIDSERFHLSNWMELALGHRKSLRFSEIGTTLVVDRAAAAFLKSGDALYFAKSIIGLRGPPNPWQILALKKAFVDVKISTEHLGYTKKYQVKNITEKAADKETFVWKGVEVTVADYFFKQYRIILKYPYLPCFFTIDKCIIPIEICRIVSNQSAQSVKKDLEAEEQANMIKRTITSPAERFKFLLKAHKQIFQQVKESLQDFKIKIDEKPIGLDGIVLKPPKLQYQEEGFTPKNGAWNLMNKSFYNYKTFAEFGILNFCASDAECKAFSEKFVKKALEMKMVPQEIKPLIRSINDHATKEKSDLIDTITKYLNEMKEQSCAFALCFFPESKQIYNLTKNIADTIIHFPTQGVALKNVKAQGYSRQMQIIANVLAKVNKKLGGVNVVLAAECIPDLLVQDMMIIGADVTHPGVADQLRSSVAASVSTYDPNHTMFYPSIRVQPKNGPSKNDGKNKIVEVIKDFKSMVQEHLENYKKERSSLPKVILYLRDGVSDGQYSQILKEEVNHLLTPYEDGSIPKVTAVVISKRILTRTIPIDPNNGVVKNHNVPPGTTIDKVITHPSDFDYFQYGHKGIIGTSRPCHYYMIHDDNNLSIDQMSQISYYLCYIFERSTSSTSAPAPVMHAHNLAFKARQWIIGEDLKFDLKGLKGEERFRAEEKIAKELNSRFSNINVDYARSSMFFI